MATYFISDLHLDESSPETAECFFNFLSNEATKADALYILGDFFEIWIGDDDLTPFNQKIFQALKHTTNLGIPTYIMHGNRDFLIGRRFSKATGCQRIKDPSVITLYGSQVLIMHGDLLCTKDTEYLKLRKKLRNPIRHFLFFLWKSLEKRKTFARNMRQKSRERFKTINQAITDADPEGIEKYMKKYQTNILIHGHTHRPNIHRFLINNQPAERIVLGSWHDKPNFLICHPSTDGQTLEFELKYL